jgi:hypothetical protein
MSKPNWRTGEELENKAILTISLYVHNDSEWEVAVRAFMDGYQAALDSEKPDGWVSVKERLPNEGQKCLWFDNETMGRECIATREVDDIEDWWNGYTHWAVFAGPKEEA